MGSTTIQLLWFLGVLFALLILERAYPRRHKHSDQPKRIANNFAMTLLNTVVIRFLAPATPFLVAIWAQQTGIGLSQLIDEPLWLNVFAGVVLLDLMVFVQHVMFHRLPFLWRFHKIHHLDLDLDVTSGFRFHFMESLLSIFLKIGVIMVLGVAPLGVVVFEIILSVMAMVTHANLKLPTGVDRWIRLIFVTPDMHRVHHSVVRGETDSNFGFNLAIWDRIFHTYIAQPERGHDDMEIGLNEWREKKDKSFWELLKLPFKKKK